MENDVSEYGSIAETRTRRRVIIALIFVLLFIAMIYLAIGFYAASEVTKIDDHQQYTDTPASYGLEYQDVSFSARGDETQIAAWYIPKDESSKTVILVHGRDASKQNAISGKIVEFGAALHEAGFSVLMIDLRGHGESQGERYSFGVYERRDVLGAVDFLLKQGLNPGEIGVYGLSMGEVLQLVQLQMNQQLERLFWTAHLLI